MKKKSLKKVTSAVLVAAMSMGLLAGCGGSKSSEEAKTDADGATVIKFGIHVANPKKQETVTYNIVQGFNKENKGKYKVEFVAADTEAHSKNMKLAAQDGSLPEIVHLDSAEAPEYNEAGYLLDMSDFLKENKDIDDALDGMEDAFNDGKVQYGLPYQSNVQGFFYNKDLFDKAGIAYPTDDTTYDEFLDMIAKLKNSGVTPIAIGSKNSGYSMWEFNEFFSRYGWEDNEKSYTGDKAKYSNDDMNACFEKIKGLADAGAFPENMATIEYFDAKQLFNEGKAAMFGTGQWDCAEFDKNVGEHIGFWWGPKFEDSSYEQNIAMKVPAAPLVVSSAVKDNDKAKEAVYAFLKYYYGEEAAKISYEGSIFPATNYDGIAATDSQYAMNAMITALGNGWETPKAAPDQTVTPAVQEAMYDAIFGVMQGTYSKKRYKIGLVIPTLVVYMVFIIIPIGMSIGYSFTKYSGIGKATFNGLTNYMRLFKDRLFWISLKNTMIMFILAFVLLLSLSFLIALLLNNKLKGVDFSKSLIFSPAIIAPIIVGIIWVYILDPNIGIINNVLDAIGASGLKQKWIGGNTLSPYSIAIIYFWQQLGYLVTVFIAGLKMIPGEVLEAVEIDGASFIQKTMYVTIPMMKSTISTVAVLIITGVFKIFEIVQQTTGGGPNHLSETLVTYSYSMTFNSGDYGYGMSLATFTFLLSLVITGIYSILTRERGE